MTSRIAILTAMFSVYFSDARSFISLSIGVTQSMHMGLALMQRDTRTYTRISDTQTALNEVQYQNIAALKSNDAMGKFIKHVISHFGGIVINPAGFEGFVPFYSGTTDTQSYDQLVLELADASWIDWSNQTSHLFAAQARAGAAPGAVSSLNEAGYRRVTQLHSDVQMNIFIRRLIAAHGGTITDEMSLDGLVPYYSGAQGLSSFDALARELRDVKWIKGFEVRASVYNSFSSGAPLSEEGYKFVSRLSDKNSMELFIRRVIASVNATVQDVTSLQKTASSLSVEGNKYAKLLADLSAAPWLHNFWVPLIASNFSEQSYQNIANLTKNGEMGRFVRVLLQSRGGLITNESAFASLIPSFSGKLRVQNFTALENALQHASFIKWIS